ncbi:MAG: lipid-A-disaccharide synthase [Ignavibacteria bacterium GWA2_54_16]|nr:MAG: lipid-A-disaccharide synthase [Ignavibacteria bacterium GWA2_54_16]
MIQKVMIIAGEASGDLHGAGVVRELLKKNPKLDVFGVGGDKMKREGMNLVYHIRELGFMGFLEVIKHLPFIKVMEHTLEQIVKFKKPDVLLLIDYPGFNLRFAKRVRKYGPKIVYYVSPQVWAWHRSRVKKMRGIVDSMLVVFPFEVDFYRQENIPVEFVGHPLLEVLDVGLTRKNFCKRYGIDPSRKILGLIPGSRRQEIEMIFPVMLRAARMIAAEEEMEIAVAVAPTLEESFFRMRYNLEGVHLVKGATYDVMSQSHFAFVTSGTATLETACFGTPMFVLYKTSWLTYIIGRLLIRVRNIGLVNIIAGKTIAPEFIQHRVSVGTLVKEALKTLRDEGLLKTMRAELSLLKKQLGSAGASKRVAQHILQMARP